MNDYISKPFRPAELIDKVDYWLGITADPKAETYNAPDKNILDRDNLELISLGNKEFLQDLLLTYIEDMELRLKQLSDSFIRKDIKRVVLESHSIKGASLSIGANKVGNEAKIIEISGKNENIKEAEDKYNDLVDAFREAKKHILDYLE
jgi:HPt (histidine-containing phosphotransfer) domain-containing protein